MLCQLSYFGTHVTRTMPEGRRPSQAGGFLADSARAGFRGAGRTQSANSYQKKR